MKLALLAAAFPPDFDAIGAYSWELSRELARQGHEVTVLTSQGAERTTAPGVRIVPFYDASQPRSLGALPARIAYDWLIVQYNPFAYGRWGYCPWLVSALREIKRMNSCKIAVMFHEVFTDDGGFRAGVMRLWQAPQARAVAALADRVFVSCDAYGEMLGLSRGKFLSLPVGSNLPEPSSLFTPTTGRLKVGAFGTSHPSHQFALMAKALRGVRAQGIDAEFLFIGSGGQTAAPHFADLPFTASGAVLAERAGQLLLTLDCLLCPLADGLSTRRGSAIAGLQHSRPLVSTFGKRTDTLLLEQQGQAFRLAQVGDEVAFVQAVVDLCRDPVSRQTLGRHARMLFERVFAWQVVAKTMTGYLQP